MERHVWRSGLVALVALAFAAALAPAAALAADDAKAKTGLVTASELQVAAISLEDGYIDLDTSTYVANGSPVELEATVYLDDEALDPESYDLVYYAYDEEDEYEELSEAPASPGEYYAFARGKGGYEGDTASSVWFRIYAENDLLRGYVDLDTYEYVENGSPIIPDATVRLGDEVLTPADYDLAYYTHNEEGDPIESSEAPNAPGYYYVYAKGKGAYKGETSEAGFTIYAKNDITRGDLDLDKNSYVANGSPVSLVATVYLDHEELAQGNYELTYYTCNDEGDYEKLTTVPKEPGEYYVTAKGKGAYKGETVRSSFTIYAKNDIARGNLELDTSEYVVNGSPVVPAVTVYLDDEALAPANYDLAYYTYNEDDKRIDFSEAPKEPGRYSVYAKAKGDYRGETESASFVIYAKNDITRGSLDLETGVFVVDGSPVQLQATVVLDNEVLSPENYDLVYYRQDEDEWEYTQLESAPSIPGEYYVAAKGKGAYTGEIDSWSIFTIYAKNDISRGRFYLNKNEYVTNGSPVVPDVAVRLGDTVLTSADYDLVYYTYDDEDNYMETGSAPSTPGDYNVYAKGKGDYIGKTSSEEFTVYAENDISRGNFYLGTSTYIANGSPVVLDATVRLDGKEFASSGYTLVYLRYDEGKDEYEELSSAPKDPGRYRVYATGKGKYEGKTDYEYFTIYDAHDMAAAQVIIEDGGIAYTGSPVKPDVVVELDDKTLPASAYELVYYRWDSNANEGDGGYVALSGVPKDLGHYYVAAKGKTPYFGESDDAGFTIYDPKDLDNYYIDHSSVLAYTGKAATFACTVRCKYGEGNKLIASAYDLAYYQYDEGKDEYIPLGSAPTAIGEYYVTAKGKGAYKGETECSSFDIVPANSLRLAGVTFSGANPGLYLDYLAVGINLDKAISIVHDGKTLPASAYTLSYVAYDDEKDEYVTTTSYPTELGWYEVSAKANDGSGYVGETDRYEFCLVESNSLRLADIDLSTSNYAYTGSAVALDYAIAIDGKTLSSNDYTLVYEDAKTGEELTNAPSQPGTYFVYAKPKGSTYVDTSALRRFTITQATSIANAKLALSATSFTYNGKVQKPAVKTVGGKALKAGTDYTVNYSNASSKDAGSYTVTVTGKGNYAGTSDKATYTIAKAANPISAKAKSKTLTAKSTKKTTLSAKKAFAVKGAQGKVTYEKASGPKKITVSKTGAVTVAKGLKKGTYKVKVNVTAAGTKNYAKATKSVTLKVKVK